ncbi:MAG: hypothetical protein K2Q01_07570, partial [Rickettsiales bacterium]|nr:hypothetical protein [Rickettsiales bacterium]
MSRKPTLTNPEGLLQALMEAEDRRTIFAAASEENLEELYHVLAEGARQFGARAPQEAPKGKEALSRSVSALVDTLLGKVEENDHGVDRTEKFFDATQYNDAKGNSTGSFVRGRPQQAVEEPLVSYWRDAIPDPDRTYKPL